MRDPCKYCPGEPHKSTCRHNCKTYKAVVKEDTRKGLIEIGRAAHDRIVRAQK